MKYGLMDLRVDIRSVGIQTIEVRGVELSRFITAYAEDLRKIIAIIPIEGL